jgi:hypothetical protein
VVGLPAYFRDRAGKTFFDDSAAIDDACYSGFVAKVVEPFQADSRDEALRIVRQCTVDIVLTQREGRFRMHLQRQLAAMAMRLDLMGLCMFRLREVIRNRDSGNRQRERHAVMAARHYALITSSMRN